MAQNLHNSRIDEVAPPNAHPRVSCSTASLAQLPLATALRLIRDAGFDGAEVVGAPETLLRGMATTRRIVERSGVRALSFHPPLLPLPGWPKTQMDRGRATANCARELGCEVAVIHAPKSRSLATPRARQYIAAIETAHTIGEANGFVIGLETTQRPWDGRPPMLFDDYDYFLQFADDHGLSVTLDTCHAAANGDDLLAVLRQIGPRLRNIHFSDTTSAPPGQRPRTHVRPGMGNTTDLAAFVRALGQSGYTGLITCEVSPLELHAWSLRAITRKLAATHSFIAEALAGGNTTRTTTQ